MAKPPFQNKTTIIGALSFKNTHKRLERLGEFLLFALEEGKSISLIIDLCKLHNAYMKKVLEFHFGLPFQDLQCPFKG